MEKHEFQNELRVLVVEDEMLIGLLLEDMLIEYGAACVGPFASLAKALAAAAQDDFDIALVDMNLGEDRADDIAIRLARRGIPFALVSGSSEIPELGQAAVVRKPFSFADIAETLTRLSRAGPKPGEI